MSQPRKLVWLDCDVGHDDALAVLIALHDPTLELIGISSVHGNAGVEHTTINAARCLEAFGAPKHIKVWPGASKPLIGLPHPAVDIHGNDGLGGVEGLPSASDPDVISRIVKSEDTDNPWTFPALNGLYQAATKAVQNNTKFHLAVTGSCTNAALFLLTYPTLARRAIEQIVCMGGGVGIGNITASAEFNIYIDPEASQILFEFGLPLYIVPLNVTHQMLLHGDAHRHLLDPTSSSSEPGLPSAATPLRHTLSTLVTFFAHTYETVFGFKHGPPIHDALVVAYIASPGDFGFQLCRVDAECSGHHSRGATVVDPYDREGVVRNVHVAQTVDVPAVLRELFAAIAKADAASPLNLSVTIPAYTEPPAAAIRAVV